MPWFPLGFRAQVSILTRAEPLPLLNFSRTPAAGGRGTALNTAEANPRQVQRKASTHTPAASRRNFAKSLTEKPVPGRLRMAHGMPFSRAQSREVAMTPNQITALRVAMAFAAVALFGRSRWANLAALVLTVGAIALDAVDGYLARRKNLATPFGAQLDILGDRVIENLFFTYFAVCGQVSLWVPVLFFARGMLTDFIRSLAARSGRVGFGSNSMLESWWGRALVASRASRAVYGALKCACFCFLGLQLTLAAASNGSAAGRLEISRNSMDGLLLGSQILVVVTVVFCLLRGLPVVCEGRRYLAAFTGGSRATLAKSKTTHNPAGTRAFGVPSGDAGR